MSEKVELEVFASAYEDLAKHGDCVIIGGQAVNFWAHYYDSKDPTIKKHLPYTSLDLDVIVPFEEWKAIRKEYTLSLSKSTDPAAGQLGVISMLVQGIGSLTIDVLPSIFGLPTSYKNKTFNRYKHLGKWKVADPLSLYLGKCANIQFRNQNKHQDWKHLSMLELIIPLYLEELFIESSCESDAKKLKKEIKTFLKTQSTIHVKKVTEQSGKLLKDLVPWGVLEASPYSFLRDYAKNPTCFQVGFFALRENHSSSQRILAILPLGAITPRITASLKSSIRAQYLIGESI